jgi:iron complex outermembrane receptor protein
VNASARGAGALALALLAGAAAAQAPVETIVVTGSPVQRALHDAPYAITSVDAAALRSAGAMVNLSEALAQVPGLVVNNRGNYAQDLQISSRGFGARAGFGVRGLRLLSDGIPASGPDGQGQVSHFDIAGAERVEVLRGPASVLYGNSSGGVIAAYSAAPRERSMEAAADMGGSGLRQLRATLALPMGEGWSLRTGASHLEIDGFRPQSRAQKTQVHTRLGFQSGPSRLTLLVNHLDQPAQDPLGLDRVQLALGPRQTAAVATTFDTRKNTTQDQAGLSWRRLFAGDAALRESQLVAYSGRRAVTQWLAIPAATQASPRHGGGVIDFERRYAGIDGRLRWAWDGLDLVAGAAVETQRDARRGFENFIGAGAAQQIGVTGRLRRDETNRARTTDAYVQSEWTMTPALGLTAGLRAGRVRLSASDRFLANGDDSGALGFDYRNPVLGLRWNATPGLNLFANLARGFESPTLGELAYRADGTGGFNTTLRPQTSRQAELGAKWRLGPALALDLTLFEVRARDEIGVATNSGGRSAFQNVGRTQRRGVELGLLMQPAAGWRTQLALGWLDARYRDAFFTCVAAPCTAPAVAVAAGNRIAGAPRGTLHAEAAWRSAAWGEWALELRGAGRMAANDRNTEFAPGYAVTALRWLRQVPLGGALALELLARIDNLADREHVGSAIVNDANGRFYEPGAPRSALLALRLQSRF